MPETDQLMRETDEPASGETGPLIEIIVDPNVDLKIPIRDISRAAVAAAIERGFSEGEIGIRVTDDKTIRELNARHLNHDYETDVISFSYVCRGSQIQGELVVSAKRHFGGPGNWVGVPNTNCCYMLSMACCTSPAWMTGGLRTEHRCGRQNSKYC